MRAQTSFHGEPALGFWRRASRRSSISRLSSAVSSSAWGASAMLFQISSTNCKRSGTGSAKASAAENLLMLEPTPASGPKASADSNRGVELARRFNAERIASLSPALNRRGQRGGGATLGNRRSMTLNSEGVASEQRFREPAANPHAAVPREDAKLRPVAPFER
jgi:hypothetical protein